MKNCILRVCMFLFAVWSSLQASAWMFEADGLYYNLANNGAEVTVGDTAYSFNGDIVIPDSVTYLGLYKVPVVGIGIRCFQGVKTINKVTLPDGLIYIDKESFLNSSLTSINIPEGVTKIGDSTFSNTALISISLPQSLTSIGYYIFKNSTSLTSCVLPSGITGIPDGMFDGCTSLSSISNDENVAMVGGSAFQNCAIERIPQNVKKIDISGFYGCKNLKSIDLTNVVTLESSSFRDCTNLTTVILPTTLSIGDLAFADCSSLVVSSIIAPSVAYYAFQSCKSIETLFLDIADGEVQNSTFSACTDLKTVRFSPVINSLGVRSFTGCNITDLYFESQTPPELQSYTSFGSRHSPFTEKEAARIIVHVPAGCKEVYENANLLWREFKEIVDDCESGVSDVVADAPAEIRVVEGRIVAEGVVEVRDVAGRLVARGLTDELPQLPAGIFIVKADDAVKKVIIK